MITHPAAFVAVSLVVIVTPGQDTALTIRNTLLGGRRGGIFTAAGVSSGQAVWAVATSLGLAVVLQESRPAFVALRLVGAAYLVYLGVQALLDAVRSRSPRVEAVRAGREAVRPARAFRQGLLSNLGNPKMVVFFTSLLPQFVSRGEAQLSALLLLGLFFALLTLTWLSLYALAVAKARSLLLRTRVRRALDAVTGTVLVALGLRLATERG